jgi:hypothetical protein
MDSIMGGMPSAPASGFLSLPTELRCHIYDYLLADPHHITISAGYVTIFGHRRQDRARKTLIPGLPRDLVPLVRSHHDPSLLSVASPPEIAMENGWSDDAGEAKLNMPAPLALLQACRLVNDELSDYMHGRTKMAEVHTAQGVSGSEDDKEGLSLHVSYPHGVLVLKHMYPFLLKQARRICISGYYSCTRNQAPPSLDSEDESINIHAAGSFPMHAPSRSYGRINTRPRTNTTPSRTHMRLDPPVSHESQHVDKTTSVFPPFELTTASLAPDALAHVVRTLLPPTPTQLVKLEARILYPGGDSYSTVWSDDQSPVSHIMRNICGGKIDMQVKRGALGTAMRVVARPKPDSRTVSTAWENWRSAGRGCGEAMEVEELDGFLIGGACNRM